MISTLIVALAIALLASPALSLAGRLCGGAVERLTASPVWRERAWSLGFHLPAAGVLQAGLACLAFSIAPAAQAASLHPAMGAGATPLAAALVAACLLSLVLRLVVLRLRQGRLARRLLAEAKPAPAVGGLPLAVTPAATSPLLLGIRAPTIVLPQRLAQACPPDVLARICAHEAAHRRRGDNLRLLAEEAVHALLWFNPLMGGLKARLRAAREEVCDEIALAGASPQMRRRYAEALVHSCRAPVTPEVLARFVGRGQALSRRVAAILRPPAAPSRSARAALVALLLALGLAGAASSTALAMELSRSTPIVDR